MLKDILHYFLIKQNKMFNPQYYMTLNPDVRKADIDPLWHFIRNGWREGRNPSPQFNTNYYLITNPDVKLMTSNPLVHYIRHGKKEGRKPIPGFNHSVNHAQHQLVNEQEALNSMTPNLSAVSSKNNNEDITICLHIGDTKTGTSIIQNFLDINRLNLYSFHHCLYPNLYSRQYESGRCHNHGEWYKSIRNNYEDFSNDIKNVLSFSRMNAINKVVLSFEEWLLDPDFIELFKQMDQDNGGIRIQIICYLRRIDYWCESAWKQWGLKTSKNIEAYLEQPEIHNRYQLILDHLNQWSNLIGINNIIIRPYEKQQLNHGLLIDFLETIEIDHGSMKWDTTEDINLATNAGFNRDVLELLHYCRELYTDVHDNHLFDLFSNLLDDQFKKPPFKSYALLSPEQRSALYQQNLPFETEIGKKFMGRESGVIFHDPEPDPAEDWQPYEGLTLEKAIPILINMMNNILEKN